MISHWSLSDSKSLLSFQTLWGILIFCMDLILPLLSISSSFLSKTLDPIPNISASLGITITVLCCYHYVTLFIYYFYYVTLIISCYYLCHFSGVRLCVDASTHSSMLVSPLPVFLDAYNLSFIWCKASISMSFCLFVWVLHLLLYRMLLYIINSCNIFLIWKN